MQKNTLEGKAKTKNGIKRLCFCAVCILLEVIFIVSMITRLNEYAEIVNLLTRLLGTILVLALYASDQTSSMKMPWIILILIFPIMGVALYLLIGLNGGTRKMRKRYEKIDSRLFPLIPANRDNLERLRLQLPKAGSISTYIQRNSSYPVYRNTDITYYDEAIKGLHAQLADLAKAEHFIFMEYHAIEDAEAWHMVQEVLEDRVKAGVEVRVFYDDMGSIGFINTDFIKKMEKVGIRCRVFNPFTPGLNMFLNNRDHRKITVIDGKVGFTGGYNLANEYFNMTQPYGMWKDTGIRLEGDAVKSLTVTFLEMWNAVSDKDADDVDVEKYLTPSGYRARQAGFVQPYADIPTDDEQATKKILAVLDEFFDSVSARRVNGELDRSFIYMLADAKHVDREALYNAFSRRDQGLEGLPDVTEEISEDEYRLAEYNVLIKSSGGDAQRFHSKNYPISYYDPVISKYFKSISLVHKLQETRAFVGFSRAEPSEMPISERKKMLRLGSENWLPAIQVHGEGIFFEFNKEAVEEWAQRPAVLARLRNLQDSYRNSKFGANVTGDLRPEFVLIHTFAHLIINQLSFECGYGSSSIRERIYCEKAENEYGMYGVLIYTASGDSEGSLGGLVRQGAKDHIEDTIRDAVRNAAWCSSDPVCIQSYGQGPESCNLAACHNCALLPETCCECGNRLLDRGTVVGTLDNKSIGFFAELLEQ